MTRKAKAGDNGAEQQREGERAGKTMGIWHIVQIVCIGLSDAGYDAQFLDAQWDEGRPDHIESLHGEEVDPERQEGCRGLGTEGDPVVTNEHRHCLACGLLHGP